MIKKFLKIFKYWPLALILGLALIKFIPFILSGRVPLPFDFVLGTYFPWLNQKWGFPIGVPVKNSELSDVVSQFYVWFNLARSQVFSGHFPLWNNTSLLGYPYYANYHSSLFYPSNLLMLLMPLYLGRTWQLVLQSVLGISFLYLYLTNKGVSRFSSLLAGFVFITAGLMTTDFEAASGSKALIWLPLILYLIDRYRLALISLAYASLLLAGNFQITIYASFIIFVYLIFYSRRHFFPLVLSLFLGFLISSPQFFPTIELTLKSIRTDDSFIKQVNYGILPLKHLITTFFAPDVYGNTVTQNYFGYWNYREATGYLGVITSFFILLALFVKKNKFLLIGFFICLFFAFDTPLAHLVYQLNLPLLKSSAASRILYPFTFFASCLFAFGFDSIANLKKEKYGFVIKTLIAFIITYAVSCLTVINSSISQRNLILPTLLLFALCLTIIFRLVFRKTNRYWFLIPIACLIIFDISRFHYKYNTFDDPKHEFPTTTTIEFLQNNPGRFTTTTSEVFPANLWTYYQLNSPLGYEPLYPAENGRLLEAINNQTVDSVKPGRYIVNLDSLNTDLVDLLNVRYVVTLKKNKTYLDKSKFTQVFTEGEVIVYENKNTLPYAYLSFNPVEVKNDTEILKLITGQKNRFPVYVTQPLAQSYPQTNSIQPLADLHPDVNGEFNLAFHNSQPAFLVVNQAFYPGWKILLDSKPVSIIKTNTVLLGAEIPPGDHQVQAVFRPLSFYLGLSLSALSLISLLVYTGSKLKFKK